MDYNEFSNIVDEQIKEYRKEGIDVFIEESKNGNYDDLVIIPGSDTDKTIDKILIRLNQIENNLKFKKRLEQLK